MKTNRLLVLVSLLSSILTSCEDETVIKKSDGFLMRGNDLAWSRDGQKLAVISSDSLFSINKDGTGEKLLATGAYSKPSWSVGDEYILYQGFGNGFSLQLIHADGSGKKELVGSDYSPQLPEWSSDGEQISFIGRNSQSDYFIYIIDKDGNNLHTVPNTGNGVSMFQIPCWTTDGEHLIFISGFNEEHDLSWIREDGINLFRFENDTLWEEYAVFENSGTSILFSSSGNIYRVNTDGTGLTSLTGTSGMAFCPRPSPDGTKIAFSSYRGGEDGLYVMNADGSEVQKMFSPGVAQATHQWSPDSKEIAFVASRQETGGINVLGVFRIRMPD